MKLAAASGETAGGCDGGRPRRCHPRTRAKLRRAICESHERHRDFDGPGQVAITARSASLVREPRKEPATNDPRGRRLQSAKMKAPETRGAKNRMGELTPWRGCRGRKNAEAGWSEAW